MLAEHIKAHIKYFFMGVIAAILVLVFVAGMNFLITKYPVLIEVFALG